MRKKDEADDDGDSSSEGEISCKQTMAKHDSFLQRWQLLCRLVDTYVLL